MLNLNIFKIKGGKPLSTSVFLVTRTPKEQWQPTSEAFSLVAEETVYVSLPCGAVAGGSTRRKRGDTIA